VIERLAKKGMIPQPPSSPWSESVQPQKLKFYLKGLHFGTVENIETAVTDQLKAIPVSDFQRFCEEWEQRLRICVHVASEGIYFDGDKLDL
jgi:hypothetical protein